MAGDTVRPATTFVGRRVIEIGGSISARYSGRVLADLGADVVTISVADAACEAAAGPRLSRYLDTGKRIVPRQPWSAVPDQLRSIMAEGSPDVAVVGGTAAEVDAVLAVLVDHDIPVVTVTPFGRHSADQGAGPSAAGGDMIAAMSGGYGVHLSVRGLRLDPAGSRSFQPGPRHQATLYAGLCVAFAAASLLINPDPGAKVLDVSEQECVADIIYADMDRVRDGSTGFPTTRGVTGASTVAGGVVGMLPCKDGYVLTSPREDHQWRLLAKAAGRSDLADDPRFANSTSRFANWQIAVEEIGRWSANLAKEDVADHCQRAHVPTFALNDVDEARQSSSPALQRAWCVRDGRLEMRGALPFTFHHRETGTASGSELRDPTAPDTVRA